ncbi:MAG: response regulator transcription factor, partial [Chloroflexi bacterium]|nr:response regulator transcription factor [Chloroflexota bacterium]
KELASLLTEAGVEIAMVYDGSNLRKCSRSLPSAVVIEEKAGQGGWEVSSQIRRKSNVPIILLGNSNSEVAWVKAAAYGVDCYMARPFGSRELAARIKTLVRRYGGTVREFVDNANEVEKV